MTREELLRRLKEIDAGRDPESGHIDADALLLEYINDPEITAAFDALTKWYA